MLYADVTTNWRDAPWGYLSRDSDFEAAATAGYMSQGRVVSVDDAQMGWSRWLHAVAAQNPRARAPSPPLAPTVALALANPRSRSRRDHAAISPRSRRYAQTLAISPLSPALFYASATSEASALARSLSRRLADPASTSEAYRFTEALFAPSHDGFTSAGATARVFDPRCFGVGSGSVAAAPQPPSRPPGSPNEILSSRKFDVRPQILERGCAKAERDPAAPPPRKLNYVVPATAPWPPTRKCAALGLGALCEVVGRVAANRVVLAAVSNKNIFHMLQLFVDGVKAAKISNSMVRNHHPA